ncbi:MAG: Tad domain-containing protein [Bdellovibrionota bacterium]
MRSSSVTKSSRTLAPLRGQDGQISIFFSASLVVLITIVAFVINIGLFVKAKINLQNATDASAFAGAAVQARHLTTIGHLNWEMRNIYKEWMFKYYVVGNLNVKDIEDPSGADGDTISFRLRPTRDVLNNITYNDPYNFPSVCIHLAGSQTNLCKRYSVPGLPEFGSSNLPGAEEASRAFINTLIGTKVLDCVDQTRLNMLVNLTWAYNVKTISDETIVDQGPQILADRQGAWPKAVEVAMRIRNLELAVNRRPETGGVCGSRASVGNIQCGKEIAEIGNQKAYGNERIIKAYFSGYRNLGNDIEDEMKESFTLTEIPPQESDLGNQRSASYLLVPQQKIQSYKKQYLDLHLQMVNYATFYNAFVPRSTTTASGPGGAPISGACDVSKVAMPVPGYPLGFYKNPDILTYYAVRGESEFVGMFNPFGDGRVKLTAYSAAKPFGGRIGPMLFFQPPNAEFFQGRTDRGKFRSVPYIASLDFVGTKNIKDNTNLRLGDFAPGTPLPINFPGDFFWIQSPTSPLGGFVTGNEVQFGLPNMVYDYQSGFSNASYTNATAQINTITTANPPGDDQAIGLFSKYQMQQFKGTALDTSVTQELLDRELKRVSAPTAYEAANYLVPSPDKLNESLNLDSVGLIPGAGRDIGGGLTEYNAELFAPLYDPEQEDVFWTNGQDVVTTVFEFLREQRPGIDKYRRNMVKAAITINKEGDDLNADAVGAKAGYTRAARGVADVADLTPAASTDQQIGSCTSLAGVFLWFYYGDAALDPSIVRDNAGCPQTLGVNLREYFSAAGSSAGFNPRHYQMTYIYNSAMRGAPNALFSAYMPGTYTGVGVNGVSINPITSEDETMRRNFYSTKFVQLGSLVGSGPWNEKTSNFVMYSEGPINQPQENSGQKVYRNPLDANAVGIDLNSIRY